MITYNILALCKQSHEDMTVRVTGTNLIFFPFQVQTAHLKRDGIFFYYEK